MSHSAAPLTAYVVDEAPAARRRRTVVITLAVGILALMAGLAIVLARTAAPGALAAPFAPSVADGLIPTGEAASITDTALPAIAQLDPALRAAVEEAEAAASIDGLTFEITSGWRSRAYQEWLFADAVETYGGAEIAAQFVAAPDRSSHVTGEAVDLGPVDAQFWLIQHGWRWGLCQIYANERWHFERATTPGGVCPELLADASG